MNHNMSSLLASLGITGGASEVRKMLEHGQKSVSADAVLLTPTPPPTPKPRASAPKKEPSQTTPMVAPAPVVPVKKEIVTRKKSPSTPKTSGKKIGDLKNLAPGDKVMVTITGRESVPILNLTSAAPAFLGRGDFTLTVSVIEEILWLVTDGGYGNSIKVFTEAQNQPAKDITGHIEFRTNPKASDKEDK